MHLAFLTYVIEHIYVLFDVGIAEATSSRKLPTFLLHVHYIV